MSLFGLFSKGGKKEWREASERFKIGESVERCLHCSSEAEAVNYASHVKRMRKNLK